jgi:hypothetical protein
VVHTLAKVYRGIVAEAAEAFARVSDSSLNSNCSGYLDVDRIYRIHRI